MALTLKISMRSADAGVNSERMEIGETHCRLRTACDGEPVEGNHLNQVYVYRLLLGSKLCGSVLAFISLLNVYRNSKMYVDHLESFRGLCISKPFSSVYSHDLLQGIPEQWTPVAHLDKIIFTVHS